MKTYGYIWTLVLLAVIVTGCRDVDDRLDKFVSDSVEFTETEVILPSAGKTESIIVTSDLDWSIEGQSEWCTVSPMSGSAGTSTIYFTSIPNPDYDDRSVNYTLVAGDKRTVLTVYQKKKDEIILDKDKFDNIPMEGAEIEVTMSTNISYTIDLPEGADQWIEHLPASRGGTRALERKTERFKIGPTEEWDERMGLIVFIREDGMTRDTVRVFQVQRDKILLTPSTIYPVIEGGERIRVDLRFNVDYQITVPAEYADWLSFTNDQADVLIVTATPTLVERYGEIHISDRNNPALKAVLEVFQVERDMVKFEETLLDVPQGGGTFRLDVLDNIEGNYELYIPKYATWIKQVPNTRAMTSSSVTIEIDENPADMIERKAKLYLKGIGIINGGEEITSVPIEITQAGREPISKVDTIILIRIQNLMGLVHNNWPGGANKLNYTGTNTNFPTTKIATSLNMPANGTYTITTELPEVVGDLRSLTSITLGGHLSGNIPVSIASLPNLTTLIINAASGNSTGFNGLPPELGGIESLETLTINHDFSGKGLDLSTILDFIGDLPNLKNLTVKNCNYGEKMPESWRNLTKLEKLTLDGTGFVDLGPISDMVSLTDINIQNDAIVDLPDLSRLTNLQNATLSKNTQLTDIPPTLMKVRSLKKLHLYPNYLERLPDDWSELVNLNELTIYNFNHSHKIRATLPPGIGALTKLTKLDVSYNEFEGEIPAELGNLTELTLFTITYNKFTSIASGVLPNFKKVTNLNLSENAFTHLPADIVEMTWITQLIATNNEFTGELPANIGNLENLTRLNLSRDMSRTYTSPGLGGFIPSSITNLKKVTLLDLSGNNFIGPIPANIGEMTALYQLSLNDNQLSGEIPLSLMNLPSSNGKQIYLQNNNLSGYIPDAFRSMFYKWKLDLRNNNLIGSVPSGLTEGTNAFIGSSAILHLSGNRLTGVIPAGLREKLKETHTVPWQIFDQQPGYGLTAE